MIPENISAVRHISGKIDSYKLMVQKYTVLTMISGECLYQISYRTNLKMPAVFSPLNRWNKILNSIIQYFNFLCIFLMENGRSSALHLSSNIRRKTQSDQGRDAAAMYRTTLAEDKQNRLNIRKTRKSPLQVSKSTTPLFNVFLCS